MPDPPARRRLAAAAALAGAAWLAGCATPAPAPGWLAGRLSIRTEAGAGQPARQLASGFELQGGAERGELRLSSPLGTLVAAARWAPGEAVLVADGRETRFADLDALALEALGEPLPLRALPDWLRGRPWAGAESRATADGFEQLGWQVATARQAEGWIEARRAAPPAVTVRARLEAAP